MMTGYYKCIEYFKEESETEMPQIILPSKCK